MSGLFGYLAINSEGIWLFLTLAFSAIILFQWVFWILGFGRFQRSRDGAGKTFSYFLGELFAKIINEFRHLLALLVVLIFAGALIYSMVLVASHQPADPIDAMSKALQAVTSALGGLIGAIIGYYFGERAGEKAGALAAAAQPIETAGVAAQAPKASAPDLVEAPQPPGEKG